MVAAFAVVGRPSLGLRNAATVPVWTETGCFTFVGCDGDEAVVRIAGGVRGTKAVPATSGPGEAVTAPSKIELRDGDVW